jgi:ABC-type multidrug transport system permease subunit
MWATLVIKTILGIAVVLILDMFCGVGLGVVSWFLVAAPFIITALATAISMGTGFDSKILNGLTKEEFRDKNAKMDDIPADSNAIINE